MNGFDARGTRWKATCATLASLALIAAVCLALRANFGPGRAEAQQAPARQFTPARPATTAAPAARPATPPQPPAASKGAAAPALAPPNPATLQTMAVVNSEPITRVELGRECIRRYGNEVLESIVNRQLIADACRQRNVQITEQDLDAEIERISTRFGLPRDRWLALLEQERGYSPDRYRREVVWPMLALRRLAADQIEVTQEELRQGFEAEFGPKVRARLIAVGSRAKAEQVRAAAVANPKAFGELSKQHTEEPGVASAYGVIPPIRKHVGDKNLEAAAFALKPGEISPVIQVFGPDGKLVENMFYILKCEEQIPQQFISSQQLAEQQKRLSERIRENKMRVAASKFFDDMQKQAQIVNVMADPMLAQAQPGIAATIGGRPITLQQLGDECIVRHGEEVLDGEVNRKLLQQELNRKRQVVGAQDIDAEVDRAADSYGFHKQDGSPDREKWLAEVCSKDGATVDLYVRDAVWPSVALKKLVGEKVVVTEEDLQKGFEANYGERVEALAIVLTDQRQAQKVWEMARNNPTDAFFAELAQQYSVEPTSRSNGGKVPPIQKHGGSKQLEDEAFRLKQGELSGILVIDGQFIILRCQGRTKPVQPEFAEVRGELYKEIHEKKLRAMMTAEFSRLRDNAQIDNFLAGTSQAARGPTAPKSATPRVGALPTAPGTVAPAGGIQGRPAGAVAPATAVGPRPQVR
ncbi:MAG: peptidylprolyl isomerase [Pirellulaceae bacterium]|nr:peptidylprolyl isomerase [Pirellulaceae bacterium]